MNNEKIYMNEWLDIHPYNRQNESDIYFVNLSNKIYQKLQLNDIPTVIKKNCAIYLSAYLEDIISGLGLWNGFTQECSKLYSSALPFYDIDLSYIRKEVNIQDIMFIIWNTLYKSDYTKIPINPLDSTIENSAIAVYDVLREEYEVAPENDRLSNFFDSFEDSTDAIRKINWLFGYTYLTQPSVQPFIKDLSQSDKLIVPCGPLALFIYEWLELICNDEVEKWKEIDGLFFSKPEMPEAMKIKNKEIYHNFTTGTNGKEIVYLSGYNELKRFLVEVLLWPDDENHSLPQMKEFKNFVLMCNREKGMLLAHDICQYISDPLNPYYNKQQAEKGAFTLLTVPTKCPPDLLEYLITYQYIPDAQLPIYGEKELVGRNADFIARCSLLYYYRGD